MDGYVARPAPPDLRIRISLAQTPAGLAHGIRDLECTGIHVDGDEPAVMERGTEDDVVDVCVLNKSVAHRLLILVVR